MTLASHSNRRSEEQNNYLWGVVYVAILKHLPPGWEDKDVHEYCLGEWSGWDKLAGLRRARLKPKRRSSRLSPAEFVEYVEFIQRHFAEEYGIYVPDPGEELK